MTVDPNRGRAPADLETDDATIPAGGGMHARFGASPARRFSGRVRGPRRLVAPTSRPGGMVAASDGIRERTTA